MVKSIYVTLRITFIVLYRTAFHGSYPREYGDALLKWWSNKLLDVVKVTYDLHDPHGVRIVPGERYIIMSNHRSHYDIPLIILNLPGSIRMLTKRELFNVPIWGPGLTAGGFIAIDRKNLEQAKLDLMHARQQMELGTVLWIAPEGTRSRTGRIGTFKKGGFILAIQAGAKIIPVGIKGSDKVLKPKTWDFYLGQNVQINIGALIDASDYSLDQKDELLKRVRHEIVKLCGEAEPDPGNKGKDQAEP